jgi:hypothetical protein
VTPKKVLGALPKFGKAKAKLGDLWYGYPPWRQEVQIAIEIAMQLR